MCYILIVLFNSVAVFKNTVAQFIYVLLKM